ncbi:hypothetical protein ABIA32_006136 [Streptacidiphilus sp. MAP12-20]|uniref:hypothetical protein n=1 Tax=Streptacidiphilus sp. MAP12-20 TaxID=3156299 RepID=UPI00351477C5
MPTYNPYPALTQALRAVGAQPVVDWGLSDYIVTVALPDGREIVISPPQEPSEPHPPRAWTVDLHDRRADSAEVVYDSTDSGPDAEHAGRLDPLLRAVRSHLPSN